ncbi:MAG: single-stranded DNA-binding protein [Muribaculum sp.]|nr:single-stranded DNA-binding protein [Muribaculum sp.]
MLIIYIDHTERGEIMYFKLLLSAEENAELEEKARKAGLDKTAYIKKQLKLKASKKNIFTVDYAINLAKTQWPEGLPFTLYELYGDDWSKIQNGVAGVLGRNFYTYVTTVDSGIEVLDKKEIIIGNQKRMQNQYVVKK